MDYHAMLRDGTLHRLPDIKHFDDGNDSQYITAYGSDGNLYAMFHMADLVWIKRTEVSEGFRPSDYTN